MARVGGVVARVGGARRARAHSHNITLTRTALYISQGGALGHKQHGDTQLAYYYGDAVPLAFTHNLRAQLALTLL